MAQSMQASVSTASHVCIPTVHRICVYLCVSVLLLLAVPAWASPARIVLANGKLHRFLLKTDNQPLYQRGHPDSDKWFAAESITIPPISWTWPCRTWIPHFRHAGGKGDDSRFAAEGITLFNNQLFLAWTADTTCQDHNAGMSVWVAAYDLTSTPAAPDGHWVGPPIALGAVHSSDLLGQGYGSGAAITVFKNQLYVFTDSATYTSGNGIGWTAYAPLNAERNDQPQDAITINAPDGPRILIVYGYVASANTYESYYTYLDAIDFTGQFNTPSATMTYSKFFTTTTAGRLSLSAGTKAANHGMAAGALAPAVQMFVQTSNPAAEARNAEYTYTSTSAGWGKWRLDSAEVDAFDDFNPSLMVYPYAELLCDSAHPNLQSIRYRIVVLGAHNGWTGAKTPFTSFSDQLVPVHTDSFTACGVLPPGIRTDTADTDNPDDPTAIRKNYWSLVGMVLGSPPFSAQGLDQQANPNPSLLAALSNVSYQQSLSTAARTTITMTNFPTLSAQAVIGGGIYDQHNPSNNFDAPYRYAWDLEYGGSSFASMAISQTMGTSVELKDTLGSLGWALFSAPMLFVQDWKAYAYDYNYQTGAGTPLNQDLQTVTTGETPSYRTVSFSLADPSTRPAILAGMPPFANSQDLAYWMAPKNPISNDVWDWQNDERWETRYGDGHSTWYLCKDVQTHCVAPMLNSSASTQSKTWSLLGEGIMSAGQTRNVAVAAAAPIGTAANLDGYTQADTTSLVPGYDGFLNWNTTTNTGLGTSVTESQTTPGCADPSCIQSLTVQPYWLKAADSTAPWIPTAYQKQLPWALTWRVVNVAGLSAPSAPAPAMGAAAAPADAFGRIVSGAGGAIAEDPGSHFVIHGGRMAWLDAAGSEQQIPMTADDFAPAKGISIEVSGLSWSPSGHGSWKRTGQVWSYASDPAVQNNRVALRLDFGSGTYDFEIHNAALSGRVPAGSLKAALTVVMNQRYTFHTILPLEGQIFWTWSKAPADNLAMHVTSFQGHYNSANGSGKLTLAGTLPAELTTFGDLEININDHPYVARLITLDGFQRAVDSGGLVRYAKEGAVVFVDFGSKTWSATFNNQAFHRLLVPRSGNVHAEILVGGVPWVRGDHTIVDYSAELRLRR